MNAKRILACGLVFMVLSMTVNMLASILTMSYYTDPAYSGLWSSIMMSTNGPPGAPFFIASALFSLMTGTIFAASYSLLKKSVPGKGMVKGVIYGLMLFLIVGVPFTLTIYLMLAVPVALLLVWALSSLIVYKLSGIAFWKIIGG
jgi:hypothetical protein